METINREPHRHHLQPIFYLKGFKSNEDPTRIWVFRRGAEYRPGNNKWNNPALLSPRATAYEEDFYAIPSITGKIDFSKVEKHLAEVELAAKSAIEQVRAGELPYGTDREVLAKYIILLWRRVKTQRARADKRWPNYAKTETGIWKAAIKQAKQNPELTLEHHKEMDRALSMLDDFGNSGTVPKQIQNSLLLNSYEKMENGLLDKKWILLINKTQTPFITSDAPVYFSGGLQKTDLTVPFSKDVALWATSTINRDAVLSLNEFKVRLINRRSVTDSHELAFASISADWIHTLLKKSPYPLDQLH